MCPVFRPVDWALYIALSLLRLAAVLVFTLWWLVQRDLWREDPAGWAILSFLIAVPLAGNLIRWAALPSMKRPPEMAPQPSLRVAAVTTCVPGIEPREMVEETLAGLVRLGHPHDAWLLDEGDDPLLRETCGRLGVRHFTRRGNPRYQTASGVFAAGWKHGNYNAWLDSVGYDTYDILIQVDPDHVPVADFSRALGYFADPAVAYIQSPQVYRNQAESLVARGAAEETYAYYSSTQMAAFGAGRPVLTGCHNAQRIQALREVGGLPDHAAEDLLLTIRYHARGWRGVYLPQIFFEGLAPATWSGYLRQQMRWARSVADIKIRHLAESRAATAVPRMMGLLQGFGYFQDAAVLLMATLALLLMLTTGAGMRSVQSLDWRFAAVIFVVFASDLFRQRFYLKPRLERGIHWRAGLLRCVKSPYTVFALWQALRGRTPVYEVTSKTVRSATVLLPDDVRPGKGKPQ
jgi:cellulose synthase/poly-beta-1,6-N-acetylglucosamine synthase-like glycosyltransferase